MAAAPAHGLEDGESFVYVDLFCIVSLFHIVYSFILHHICPSSKSLSCFDRQKSSDGWMERGGAIMAGLKESPIILVGRRTV